MVTLKRGETVMGMKPRLGRFVGRPLKDSALDSSAAVRPGHVHADLTTDADVQHGAPFTLGRPRFVYGDATEPGLARVLVEPRPELLTTDPPYGVSYNVLRRLPAARPGRHAVGPATLKQGRQ